MNEQKDKAIAAKYMLANAIQEIMSKQADTFDEAEAQLNIAAKMIDEYVAGLDKGSKDN